MKNRKHIVSIIIRVIVDLLKGSAAALAGMVGLVLGGMIAQVLGLPMPTTPAYMNQAILLPLMFLSLIPVAIVLGECYQLLPFNTWQRFTALFVNHYILYFLANQLDAYLYSPMPNMSTTHFTSLFQALLLALVIALLWRPEAGAATERWSGLVHKVRTFGGFGWRFMVAWLCYPPIYYLIGLLVAPFTKIYYEDPSHQLGLFLPPVWAILLMQIPRGLLFLLAVLPMLLLWKGSRQAIWWWTGTIIFLQIASAVAFQAYWLPPIVRIPHSMELFTDSFLQAALYVALLGQARKKTNDFVASRRLLPQ